MADGPQSHARPTVSPLLWCLVIVALLVVFNRDSIVFGIELNRLLDGEVPAASEVNDLIRTSGREQEIIETLWRSDRLALRRIAAELLAAKPKNAPLPDWAEGILIEGATDRDYSVRETALRNLSYRRVPQVEGLLLAQLPDPDPEIQIMAIDFLRTRKFTNALPNIADQLTNSRPQVIARAAATIRAFTSNRFGITSDDLINAVGAPEKERAEGLARFMAATARARDWWEDERTQHPKPEVANFKLRPGVIAPLELADASLKPANLAAFSGRPLLLCFLTSWCPSCAMTIDHLKELKPVLGEVALLGISLDAIPDDHNHFGEDEADDHGGHGHEHDHAHDHAAEFDPGPIVRKSEQILKERGIKFPVFFDVRGRTTGELDGGEIPAFVLLDAERRLVRRFSGFRNAEAIRAIVAHHFPPANGAGAEGE
ncbi:MAG: thiol-disulfide isomerase/thioredoxin [Limisphaerales bacterium]|jgi:thiol-disulfide isomerase/thioredoxin